MSMPYIKLEEAGKRYLTTRFSMEINKHDFLVISGGNGTGKTTLLLLILGFIYPDYGMISKKKLKVGYVPEKVMLPPLIKVMDYLKTMAKIKNDHIDSELIHYFELPIDKTIYELSKGNQQKIALLTALMGKPHLVILDEPLSGLDDEMKKRFVHVIKTRHDQGLSVMISTHEPMMFSTLATKHISL